MNLGSIRSIWTAAGLAAAAMMLLLTACGGGVSAEAESIAKTTCTRVYDSDGNPAPHMLDGFRQAEAAGISEANFRTALFEACAMEPPPVAALEGLADE